MGMPQWMQDEENAKIAKRERIAKKARANAKSNPAPRCDNSDQQWEQERENQLFDHMESQGIIAF